MINSRELADPEFFSRPESVELRARPVVLLSFHARADKVDTDVLVERLLAGVPQEA